MISCERIAAGLSSRQNAAMTKQTLSTKNVVKLLQRAIEDAGSLRALQQKWGMSRNYYWEVCQGIRPPSPKLLSKLGLVQVPPPPPRYRLK